MHTHIAAKTVPHCTSPTCNGLVKPKIVFFGEQLPREFFDNIDLVQTADLCIVMGTSLSVHPFASLPGQVDDAVPRLLINMEQVGSMGSRPDDVLILKDCDTGVKELARALGWEEELEALWAGTKREGQFVPESAAKGVEGEAVKSRDEALQDEVDKLTQDIDKTLKLGREQQKWLDGEKEAAQQGPRGTSEENEKKGVAETDPRVLAPVVQDSGKKSGSALGHIFPFLSSSDKKSGAGGSNL